MNGFPRVFRGAMMAVMMMTLLTNNWIWRNFDFVAGNYSFCPFSECALVTSCRGGSNRSYGSGFDKVFVVVVRSFYGILQLKYTNQTWNKANKSIELKATVLRRNHCLCQMTAINATEALAKTIVAAAFAAGIGHFVMISEAFEWWWRWWSLSGRRRRRSGKL